MRNKKIGRMPRCCAWIAAILLTATLSVTLLGAVAVHGMSSEDLHIRAATSDESVAEQTRQMSAYIAELAEDYGFSASETAAVITADELRNMDRKMAQWWTRIVNDGVMEPMPEWSSDDVRTAVGQSLDGSRIPAGMTPDETTAEITDLIQKRVREVTMPVRRTLIQKGFQFLRKRVNPSDALRFLTQGTLLAGGISLVLIGTIALLTGKRIRLSLRYFGAAAAGTALACLFACLLIQSADILPTIRETSQGLAIQVAYILKTITVETLIGVGVLFVGGIACLVLDIRRPD